jgi:hypothetical protein
MSDRFDDLDDSGRPRQPAPRPYPAPAPYQPPAPPGSAVDKVNAVTGLLGALTLGRLALAAVAGFLGIVGYAGWEQRAAVAAAVVSSPVLLSALGGGVLLVGVGLVFRALVTRLEELNARRVDDLSARLREVEEELVACKVECKAEAVATHQAIKAALERIEGKLGG